jgi:NAD(P)-dependent dehydrogenase (short-subunit alcohol dehydrogenase family)
VAGKVAIVIPEMRKVGGGAIVNVSSMSGSVAMADAIALQATRGAVTLLIRSAAVSLRGRAGEPRDIANGVLSLVSDEASHITGTGLLIDGGISALP